MEKKCSAVILGVGPEQGLGASLACCFAEKGLQVFIAGRSEDKLHKVADKIRQQGGSVICVVADATVEPDVADLFNIVRIEGYNIDIAAYNVDSNIPVTLTGNGYRNLYRTLATKLSGRLFIWQGSN